MTMPSNSVAFEPAASTEEAPKQSTSKLELSAKTVKLLMQMPIVQLFGSLLQLSLSLFGSQLQKSPIQALEALA